MMDVTQTKEAYYKNQRDIAAIKEAFEKNEKSPLKDSGARREFEGGAVRDIQEGKGRCDLLPLAVAAKMMAKEEHDLDTVLMSLANFQYYGQTSYLFSAMTEFMRGPSTFRNRPDMLMEVAKHFEDGAKKYAPNNWKKGIPTHSYLDSAVRHYLKFRRGDKDEAHDRAFIWNIMCLLWTLDARPDLDDIEYDRKEKIKE